MTVRKLEGEFLKRRRVSSDFQGLICCLCVLIGIYRQDPGNIFLYSIFVHLFFKIFPNASGIVFLILFHIV